MKVTIDGPAGAGKSSIAKRLADSLGFEFLDTGAMYRAVTLAAIESGIELTDVPNVARKAKELSIQFDGTQVFLDGRNVTREIRTPEISAAIKEVADNIEVRKCMVESQIRWAKGRNVVTEGRDQGTVAFPKAECKIFLTASSEIRAERRVLQLREAGIESDYASILKSQRERDEHDETRPVGALIQAEDAVVVNTDGLSEDEVLETLIRIVESKRTHVLH